MVGFLLFVTFLSTTRSGKWDSAILNMYFLFQFLPMIIIAIGSMNYYKLMRLNDSRTIRKAELNPRSSLYDFIPPVIIGLVLFVYFGFIALIIYIKQFNFPWLGGYMNIIIITLRRS